jgi:hypothetical protein
MWHCVKGRASLRYLSVVRHGEENEGTAIPARNGLAFTGKNAIAAPDPAPDTIWR